MKNINKTIRLVLLVLMVMLAAVLPVPINFYRKEENVKFNTEQIDKEEESEENGEVKEIG